MVSTSYKAPTYAQREKLCSEYWTAKGYEMVSWLDFDYAALSHIMTGRQRHKIVRTYNDIIIMADTETSKSYDRDIIDNHIVCWTISLRAAGCNIATLYGRRPSDFCECCNRLISAMAGQYTLIYFHNLSYDYVFLRKFIFDAWGYPVRQLNTKPHYPLSLEFENGIILRDSLALAQRSLEKWADDLNIEHKKAVGDWDYNLIRDQDTALSDHELHYIEHDTLAGVECLDALRLQLNKKIWQMPYTATGIVREDVRRIGKKNRAKEAFLRACPTLDQYQMLERVYHGGFVHANRHEIGYINPAVCYDFASSYPFVLLSEKYPAEKFMTYHDCDIREILDYSRSYAFMFKLILWQVELIDDDIVMPALQFSKAYIKINAITDNGRMLKADYVEIYLTEQDLAVIEEQYKYRYAKCVEVFVAEKAYLPRWLTDYIYKLFADKTQLKGGDPVAYALAKAKLNSVYGLTVQKWLRDDILEDFETGEYIDQHIPYDEQFDAHIKNMNNILLYQIGVWVTAYAFRNLFELGKCISGQWLYADTDSAYATAWDEHLVGTYNQMCIDKLAANGYGPVEHAGRAYYPGIAELDGTYSEFVSCGAKRYACRDLQSGQLKITVAGVPKKTGAKCLNNDIRNFKKGFVFSGRVTGKLTHTYNFVDDIYTDAHGNQIGDSINLTPCDYLLDSVYKVNWQNIDYSEILIQSYD